MNNMDSNNMNGQLNNADNKKKILIIVFVAIAFVAIVFSVWRAYQNSNDKLNDNQITDDYGDDDDYLNSDDNTSGDSTNDDNNNNSDSSNNGCTDTKFEGVKGTFTSDEIEKNYADSNNNFYTNANNPCYDCERDFCYNLNVSNGNLIVSNYKNNSETYTLKKVKNITKMISFTNWDCASYKFVLLTSDGKVYLSKIYTIKALDDFDNDGIFQLVFSADDGRKAIDIGVAKAGPQSLNYALVKLSDGSEILINRSCSGYEYYNVK